MDSLLDRQINAALDGPNEAMAVKALIVDRLEELMDCQEELRDIWIEQLKAKYWQGLLTGVFLAALTAALGALLITMNKGV